MVLHLLHLVVLDLAGFEHAFELPLELEQLLLQLLNLGLLRLEGLAHLGRAEAQNVLGLLQIVDLVLVLVYLLFLLLQGFVHLLDLLLEQIDLGEALGLLLLQLLNFTLLHLLVALQLLVLIGHDFVCLLKVVHLRVDFVLLAVQLVHLLFVLDVQIPDLLLVFLLLLGQLFLLDHPQLVRGVLGGLLDALGLVEVVVELVFEQRDVRVVALVQAAQVLLELHALLHQLLLELEVLLVFEGQLALVEVLQLLHALQVVALEALEQVRRLLFR